MSNRSISLDRAALLVQIASLADAVHTTRQALNDKQFDSRVQQAVRSQFEWRLNDLALELENMEIQAKKAQLLQPYWEQLKDIENECRPLFAESLQFLQGTLFRRAGLDSGYCNLADAMLFDFKEHTGLDWNRKTIFAENEYFTGLAQIIRLRFPHYTIWELPVAAHEFGHFAAGEILARVEPQLFTQILNREGLQADERNLRLLHEQFADLFAVYALGPAYACTCLLLRFSPLASDQDGYEHPSEVSRAYWILRTLQIMDEEDETQPMFGVRQDLESAWGKARLAVNRIWPLPPEIRLPLNERLETLYRRAVNKRLVGARYKSLSDAYRLYDKLKRAEHPSEAEEKYYNMQDVLNGAWLARLADMQHAQKIGDLALEWAQTTLPEAS
jgi:hypothetical protein